MYITPSNHVYIAWITCTLYLPGLHVHCICLDYMYIVFAWIPCTLYLPGLHVHVYCVHATVYLLTCISELWFSQNNCSSLNSGSISLRDGDSINDPPPPDTKLAVLAVLESILHLLESVLELEPLATRLICSYWRDSRNSNYRYTVQLI